MCVWPKEPELLGGQTKLAMLCRQTRVCQRKGCVVWLDKCGFAGSGRRYDNSQTDADRRGKTESGCWAGSAERMDA